MPLQYSQTISCVNLETKQHTEQLVALVHFCISVVKISLAIVNFYCNLTGSLAPIPKWHHLWQGVFHCVVKMWQIVYSFTFWFHNKTTKKYHRPKRAWTLMNMSKKLLQGCGHTIICTGLQDRRLLWAFSRCQDGCADTQYVAHTAVKHCAQQPQHRRRTGVSDFTACLQSLSLQWHSKYTKRMCSCHWW